MLVERQRIDALLEGTGVDLNQLKELIAAYSSADTSLQDQISAINSNITIIQSQLAGTDATLNTLLANIAVTDPYTYTQMYTATALGGSGLRLKDMDGNSLTREQYKVLLGQYIKIDDVVTTFYKSASDQIHTEYAGWTVGDVSAVYVRQPMPSYEQKFVITSIINQRAFLEDMNGVALTDSQYADLNGKLLIIYTSNVSWSIYFGAGDASVGIEVTTPGTLGTQDFLDRPDIQALLPAVPIHMAV